MNMVQREVGCCCSELVLQRPGHSSPKQGQDKNKHREEAVTTLEAELPSN